MKIKEMELTDLLKLRDALKIVFVYIDLLSLRRIQKEIQIELEKRKEK